MPTLALLTEKQREQLGSFPDLDTWVYESLPQTSLKLRRGSKVVGVTKKQRSHPLQREKHRHKALPTMPVADDPSAYPSIRDATR